MSDKIHQYCWSYAANNTSFHFDYFKDILKEDFDVQFSCKFNYQFLTTAFIQDYGLFTLKTVGLIYSVNLINPVCAMITRLSSSQKMNIAYINPNTMIKIEEKWNENMFRNRKIEKGMKEILYLQYYGEEPRKNETYAHLEYQMTEKGMKLKKNVQGDGNCQFRAVANQLGLNDDYFHVPIRSRAVRWLRDNKDTKIGDSELFHFNYEYETWEKFCDAMADDSVWGDHITLIAIANEFKILIHCVTSEGENVEVLPLCKREPLSADNKTSEIWLFHYVNGKHYLSVDPIDKVKWLEEKKIEDAKKKEKEGIDSKQVVEEKKEEKMETSDDSKQDEIKLDEILETTQEGSGATQEESKNEKGQEEKKKKKKKKKKK
jgi:hypothetical protein